MAELISGLDDDGKQREVKVEADGTLAVSGTVTATVDTSALATSAAQSTGNASLGNIDGDLDTVKTDLAAVKASVASTDAKLPASLGQKATSASASVVLGRAEYDKQSTLATTGKAVYSGGCTPFWISAENTTGVTIYLQVHDGTSTPSVGARPVWYSSSIANGALTQSANIGHATYGLPCATGLFLVASITQAQYSAAPTSGVSYNIVYAR